VAFELFLKRAQDFNRKSWSRHGRVKRIPGTKSRWEKGHGENV
jgi:hypothetical protein